jgi:hypothetical protein
MKQYQPAVDVNGKLIVYHQDRGLKTNLMRARSYAKKKSINYKGKFISCKSNYMS